MFSRKGRRGGERERGIAGERETGREGERERGGEGERETGTEGERERGREGERDGGKQGVRERWGVSGGAVQRAREGRTTAGLFRETNLSSTHLSYVTSGFKEFALKPIQSGHVQGNRLELYQKWT